MERRINVFDVNLTDEKQEEAKLDGEVFVTQRISEEDRLVNTVLEQFSQEINHVAKTYIRGIVVGSAAMVASYILLSVARGNGTTTQAATEHPTLFWMSIACFAIAVVLFASILIWSYRCNHGKLATLDQQAEEQEQKEKQLARERFGIPNDAVEIDVLMQCYSTSKRNRRKPLFSHQWIPMKYQLYLRGTKLCFANEMMEVSIPSGQIFQISRIDRKVQVYDWNRKKDGSLMQRENLSCTIRKKSDGVTIKPCYALQISNAGIEYKILIPGYDIAPVITLTGRQIGENTKE